MSGNSISLLELNRRVREFVKTVFAVPQWVHGEINEIRENASGICYLELVEKGEGEAIVARQKAMIWANVYRQLKPYFESVAQTTLREGIKISVLCKVEFHELYGMSLSISDIDPTYTLGDMALRKQMIIDRLKEEGVWDMNRMLPLPELPQRIAVISSPTAAGYGDFVNQLEQNRYGYRFRYQLFAAVMQGEQTEQSVLEALDAVYSSLERFDVLVLIRGGGSTSDLSCFDSYLLASHLAQFPLPVVCGIGHQRDNTIPDMVAHTRVNTPTAAADLLIELMHRSELEVEDVVQRIVGMSQELLMREQMELTSWVGQLSLGAKQQIVKHTVALTEHATRIDVMSRSLLRHQVGFLERAASVVESCKVENVLRRGFVLARSGEGYVKSSQSLQKGDTVSLVFYDGEQQSVII